MNPTQHHNLIPTLRFPEFQEEEDWMEEKLEHIIDNIKSLKKLKSSEYLLKGVYPIVDQSQQLYCGWINDPSIVIFTKTPVIIFGDHTCAIKLISRPFAEGSDGIKMFKAKQKISTTFLYYFISQNNIKQENYKRHFSLLKEKTVFYPKMMAEQEKIAACLSSLDGLLTAEEQKLALLKTHKKGLLQQLFPQQGQNQPQLRFPEFTGDWEEKMLGEVFRFVDEKIKLENISIDSYLSTENILPDYAGVIIASKLPLNGNYTKFTKEDILISNIRPYLKKIWFSDKDGACSNDVIVMRNNSNLNSKFVSFIIKNDKFINYVMKGAEGVKMPRGDKDSIKKYPILFPKTNLEQEKIAACLSSLEDCIRVQGERIEALRQHKKGLLQGLFPKATEASTASLAGDSPRARGR